MTIELLTEHEWVDRGSRCTETPRPTWAAVRAAVERLDNDRHNDLYLQPALADPETYLCIGGGGGRYLVSGSIGNEVFPTAIDPANPATELVPLVVGGQEGLYPANRVLGLDLALRAARAYFELGHPGGDATWVYD